MESAEVVLPWVGSGLTCQGRIEALYGSDSNPRADCISMSGTERQPDSNEDTEYTELSPFFYLKFSVAQIENFNRKIGEIIEALNHREGCAYFYRSGTVNSNMVNSKFHLIRSFFEIFARFLLFHV